MKIIQVAIDTIHRMKFQEAEKLIKDNIAAVDVSELRNTLLISVVSSDAKS
jgi:hypothetical protein